MAMFKLEEGETHDDKVAWANETMRAKVAQFDVEGAIRNIILLFAVLDNAKRSDVVVQFLDVVVQGSLDYSSRLLTHARRHADFDEIDLVCDKMRVLFETTEYIVNMKQLVEKAAESEDEMGEHGIFTTNKKKIDHAVEEMRKHLMLVISKRDSRRR